MLFGLEQVVGSVCEIAALSSDHPDVPEDLAPPGPGVVAGDCEQLLALRERFVVATRSYVELDLVHGEIQLASPIPVLLERSRRFIVRDLGVTELTQLHVRQRDIVQYLRFVISHSERLVAEVAQAKCLERGAEVAANHRHRAEILIDHRDERGVASQLRLSPRRGVDCCCLVQISADLIDNPDNIEGLGDRGRRPDDGR